MKTQVHDHDDVSQELYDIIRSDKEFRMVGWVLVLALTFLHIVGVAIAVDVAQWLFASSNQMTITVIVAVAYAAAVISYAVEKTYRKISRIEMHALTLHNEILQIKEQQESSK